MFKGKRKKSLLFLPEILLPNTAMCHFFQVTYSMFGASRKKFVEGVESDYHDENMYYSQSSMFPHRSEKDVRFAILILL